jgi:hypothetical protein
MHGELRLKTVISLFRNVIRKDIFKSAAKILLFNLTYISHNYFPKLYSAILHMLYEVLCIMSLSLK